MMTTTPYPLREKGERGARENVKFYPEESFVPESRPTKERNESTAPVRYLDSVRV
jgi:hypothetical protein